MMETGKEELDVLRELGLKEKPLSGKENYALLEKLWKMEKMKTFRDFLRWYNNKDVVPTLQAMKKMIKFYHAQKIDMLKLGCTLPNLANICLHKSTDRKFYPFIEADKDLHEKIRSEMTGGPSIVFTRKVVVDKTFIRRSNNICKAIVGIDASQLYPFSMCQAMPTGLYTRWEFDSDLQKFNARQNKIRKFENMVMSFYQATRSECTIESFYTTGKQKKLILLLWMVFVVTAKQFLKPLDAPTISVPVGKLNQILVRMNLSLVSGYVNPISYESFT